MATNAQARGAYEIARDRIRRTRSERGSLANQLMQAPAEVTGGSVGGDTLVQRLDTDWLRDHVEKLAALETELAQAMKEANENAAAAGQPVFENWSGLKGR